MKHSCYVHTYPTMASGSSQVQLQSVVRQLAAMSIVVTVHTASN